MPSENAVLVVDDDSTTVMLLRRYLEGLGIASYVASDGAGALSVLDAHRDHIGLVLLDIAMPHMNGFELCKVIRNELGLVQMPVIAVTARSSPELPQEAEEAGIDQVVAKPFMPAVIKEILEQYGLIAPKS
jgi:CheY-like chemotaxis protein